MKLQPIQTAPLFGTILVFAIAGASSAWAKATPSPKGHAARASRHVPGAGAGLAVGGAAATAALMAGGGSQVVQGLAAVTPKISRQATVSSVQGLAVVNRKISSQAATPKPAPGVHASETVITAVPGISRVVTTRVRNYATIQPPSLVVTDAIHRRLTTTSVVIPNPAGADPALQVRTVDRFINQTPSVVVQEIIPAHAVERGIDYGYGNKGPASTPEPAPGIIVFCGVLGIGALVFARKRRGMTVKP